MSCNHLTKRNSVLGFKLEAVCGTPETIAAADCDIQAVNPTFEPDVQQFSRAPARGSMSKLAPTTGRKSGKIAFSVHVAGSGDAGVAPSWGKALQVCGFAEDTVTTGIQYSLISDAIPTATIALYVDGLKHQIYGAAGTVKFQAASQSGEPARLDFEFTGSLSDDADAALPTGITWEVVVPPPFTAVAMSFLGEDLSTQAYFSNLSWDLGGVITPIEDATAENGVRAFDLSDRDVKGSIDPAMCLVADVAFGSKLKTATTGAVVATWGSDAGNTITLSAPAVALSGIKYSERGGVVIAGCELAFVSASAATVDDELVVLLSSGAPLRIFIDPAERIPYVLEAQRSLPPEQQIKWTFRNLSVADEMDWREELVYEWEGEGENRRAVAKDYSAWRVRFLNYTLVGWEGPGAPEFKTDLKGRPTTETTAQLHWEVAEELLRAADEINAFRDETDAKNS